MKKRQLIAAMILIAMAVVILILSMSFFGSEGFRWFKGFIWDTELSKNSVSIDTMAFCVVGIGLSISGAAMQGITRNDLASSYSLGTVAASSLSMIIANYVFDIDNGFILVLVTISITMVISSFFLLITFSPKVSSSKVIVIGLIFSIFLSSITYILRDKFHITAQMISFLSVNTFNATWSVFYITAPIILTASFLLILLGKRIRIYETNPEKAKSLGINKNKLRATVSVLTIFIAASCVYLVGPIAFVGILMPQLARTILGDGASTRKIMLVSIPLSTIILLSAQMLTRQYYHLGFTINVLIAVLAGPLIIYKLVRRRNA